MEMVPWMKEQWFCISASLGLESVLHCGAVTVCGFAYWRHCVVCSRTVSTSWHVLFDMQYIIACQIQHARKC